MGCRELGSPESCGLGFGLAFGLAINRDIEMSIVDDYAAIAAELRRLETKKRPADDSVDSPREPMPHRMRATIAGELLYWRLVSQRMQRSDRTPYGRPFCAYKTAASPRGYQIPVPQSRPSARA